MSGPRGPKEQDGVAGHGDVPSRGVCHIKRNGADPGQTLQNRRETAEPSIIVAHADAVESGLTSPKTGNVCLVATVGEHTLDGRVDDRKNPYQSKATAR